MSRKGSGLTLVLGILLLSTTHFSILDGSMPLRYSDRRMLSTDSGFWFFTGSFYGLGLIMVLSSVIYLTTGDRYLPSMDTKDRTSTLAYSCLILLVTCVLGFVLKDILPSIYLGK